MAFLIVGCAQTNQTPQGQQAPPTKTEQPAEKQQAANAEAPRRGCPACHTKISDEKDYSLIAEATERANVRKITHPTTAPDGTRMDDKTKVNVCLQCHKPGTGGRAAGATRTLRTIVHPAHMGSEPFIDKYRGNCFTCHEVDNTGVFTLLSDVVAVNEKGVPETIPIPGTLAPSERPGNP